MHATSPYIKETSMYEASRDKSTKMNICFTERKGEREEANLKRKLIKLSVLQLMNPFQRNKSAHHTPPLNFC
jgi:hypothetical protein